MSEENKAVVQRFVGEVINGRNLTVADELFTPGSFSHNAPPGALTGPEGSKRAVGSVHAAFPDMSATIEDIIAEGDFVAARITIQGTHQGEFQGIPPTGKPMVRPGIYIVRVENGRIAETWNDSDNLGMMRQLGVIPPKA